MAIIPLNAWYLRQYEPLTEVIKRPPDLHLSRNSLLKSALRADFLDESQAIEAADWFERYLEGETIEFYIEGSGGYVISNLDLVSHEIYFTKQAVGVMLDPAIFLSYQSLYPDADQAIQAALTQGIETLNERSRLPLTLEMAKRPLNAPLRISSTQLRQIRRSLLFIADVTPIMKWEQGEQTQLFPSPQVSVELGYALQSKRPGQILLIHQQRAGIEGQLPFDLPQHQHLGFEQPEALEAMLTELLETLLARFNLF